MELLCTSNIGIGLPTLLTDDVFDTRVEFAIDNSAPESIKALMMTPVSVHTWMSGRVEDGGLNGLLLDAQK